MERIDTYGIVHYANERLGIPEGSHQTNAHFYPEGKEKRVLAWGKPATQIGYDDPINPGGERLNTRWVYVVYDDIPGVIAKIHPSKLDKR